MVFPVEPSPEEKALAALPYEELKKYCFTHECNWNIWKEKAYKELGVYYEFFDNSNTFPKPLSGLERYLTLMSYKKLTPLSTVRVYKNGFIEGVYESLAGALEALRRASVEGLEVFVPRLKNQALFYFTEQIIGKEITETEKAALDLAKVDTSEVSVISLNLKERIERGDVDAYKEVLKNRLNSAYIQAAIASGKEQFIKKFLPYMRKEFNVNYLNAALFSCNPRILTFFINLYDTFPIDLEYLANGYTLHRNFLGAYQCLKIIAEQPLENKRAIWETGNLDLIYYLMETEDLEEIIRANLGNIPLILSLPDEARDITFHTEEKHLFPLSAELLEK